MTTPRRARKCCAKSVPFTALKSFVLSLFRHRKGKHVKHLSNQLARDIGLSSAQMERHRHIWPSQSSNHPRL